MQITENIIKIRSEIPLHVRLVAVSKTKGIPEIMKAYDAGQRLFGENKVQEMIAKQPELPADIQWHFIGHLQTNKVKFIAPFVAMIESVDRLKVLREINRQAEIIGRVIPCLLQFHIAEEETKFGLDLAEAEQMLNGQEYKSMKNIQLQGVMGMATFTEEIEQVRREFKNLNRIFQKLKSNYFATDPTFSEISMGMSGDYQVAIEEGSTLIRVGSLIFGERN
ncbi:MAG: YggS family pyridoxal phosphate-dependent enzyme [Bacteroidales bacterium]|nr:YggS family pyridoxal phosphate-dependent enzyme [Bacteroidales bacterium]